MTLAISDLKKSSEVSVAKPFVKWVGGKGRLIGQMSEYFPHIYNTYYEPFVGGGAVFFALKPERAVLNDINATLIHAYQHIQQRPQVLLSKLKEIQDQYYELSLEDQKEYFYEARERYNSTIDTPIERTAELIFLNKTCFNGMYRENAKGGFNVPFGKHKRPLLADTKNITAISALLEHIILKNGGYQEAIADASEGDFVYLDPPYYPLNPTSSFTSYSKDNFLEQEQVELQETFVSLGKRGVKVMLSNSSAPFIKELYQDFRQVSIYAGRAINSQGDKRGVIEELLILNY